MRTTLIALILFCFVIAAPAADSQDKKPEPAKPAAAAPAPALSEALQVKLLKAKLAVKDAQADMASLESKWQQIQSQAKDLQAQAPQLSQKMTAAQAALNKEVEDAAKAIGIDPAKYDFDQNAMVFNPKATPAPATPSPEKK